MPTSQTLRTGGVKISLKTVYSAAAPIGFPPKLSDRTSGASLLHPAQFRENGVPQNGARKCLKQCLCPRNVGSVQPAFLAVAAGVVYPRQEKQSHADSKSRD